MKDAPHGPHPRPASGHPVTGIRYPRGARGGPPIAALVAALRPARCVTETAYDSEVLRARLCTRGCQPVIPNTPTLAKVVRQVTSTIRTQVRVNVVVVMAMVIKP